ncbi:hypothetical protein B0C58_003613 [Salmonella enterica subsp. enterica serovar Oranienburg]|nr:hypothetical protein [Salmonella enterica subsp. enterica serovar Oranienburg]
MPNQPAISSIAMSLSGSQVKYVADKTGAQALLDRLKPYEAFAFREDKESGFTVRALFWRGRRGTYYLAR